MALSIINAAVHRRDSSRREALLDRLFAFWFSRFVYNQIWEDPAVDLAALAIDASCRIVTIASGGCNVLNYLAADPGEIVAVAPSRNAVLFCSSESDEAMEVLPQIAIDVHEQAQRHGLSTQLLVWRKGAWAPYDGAA